MAELFDLFMEDEPKVIYVEEPEMTEMEKVLWSAYGDAWSNKRLLDSEYPDEKICAECKGCGSFKKENDEDGECFQDKSDGECYHRYFDAQQFGEEVANYLEK